MIFGQQISHIVSGLTNPPYSLTINNKIPSTPVIYNCVDAITIGKLNAELTAAGPSVFVGVMAFSVQGVGDGKQFLVIDPRGNSSFIFSDNDTNMHVFKIPIIMTSVETFLNAKFQYQVFGYMFPFAP